MQNQVTFSAMLKTVYRSMMQDMLNSETALWDRFKKAPEEIWEGRNFVEWPLRIGRTEAFGSGRPGSPLPQAQHQPTIPMKWPLRYLWGRVAFDVPAMKVARSNRGSYQRVVDFEMEYFKEDFIDYVGELCWYDGRGVIALASAAGAGTVTLAVDTPRGVPGAVNGARFCQPNQRLAILDPTGSTILATRRVQSVADDGTSIDLNQPVSAIEAPDNAILVRCPNLGVTDVADCSYLTDPMGLLGMIDDGTIVANYGEISRLTVPAARSPVFGGVGALSLDILQQAYDVARQLGKGRIQEHWMFFATRRSYLALTIANRRFISNGGTANNDIGFKGAGLDTDPEFNGSPVKCDKDAPYDIWFGLDPKHCLKFNNTDFEWADEDGNVLDRQDDVDAYEARARMFFNLCYQRPQASFRVDGIATNKVVAHIR